MFRANFQRTGVYKTNEIRQLRGLKWKFRQSTNLANWVPGWNWDLAVANGVVCANNPGGYVYGLDSQTGEQLWECQLGKKQKFFSPGIAEGVVYIGIRQLDKTAISEYLCAIDVQSGRQKWTFQLPLQSPSLQISSVLSFSSPVINNGVAYLGGTDGNLYAINAAFGELIWQFKTTKDMPVTSPVVADNILCAYSGDGYLYTIDLETREQLWKFEIGGLSFLSSPCAPAIAKGKVYFTSSDRILYALDLHTGQPVWTFQAGNNLLYSPAITERIACIGSGDNLFYILDVETGQILRSFKVENVQHCSSPIITSNLVYIGNEGFLQALDLETGKEVWQFQPPLPDRWMLDPQMWLYGFLNQLVKAFTGSTSELEKFSSPVIADGVIYASCSNGYLYALH